jgi:hypothetical protein
LSYIGNKAKNQLYEEHLKGQDITYHDVYTSASGTPRKNGVKRRLVEYKISGKKADSVSIGSFPLHLYERRTDIRSGDAKRRGILTRKFKGRFSARVSRYMEEAEKEIVNEWYVGANWFETHKG